MALIDKLNAIGDAIRAKTGKTDKLTLDQMPLEIESITGGGATVEDIIPEQELTFALDESSGAYMLQGYNLFNITSMTVGTKYKVLWGEREDECTAIEVSFYGYPMIAIGNPVMIGGENNNLPFAIGYITIPDDGDSQYSCIIASLDGSTSKNVRVHHEASGGVQDERVKYVTFIGLGGVELYRQPVIVGETCQNPVAKNYIETPTKESTVQYTYTYSGWSLTEGGSASSSALANVTEDRTVYAAFTEAVRTYTITYYDSDGTTVLATKSVDYGSLPSYIPSKTGYSLIGWQPELVAVTGDASYVAQWEELVTFAGSSWADIIAAVEEGKAETLFAVGNTRTELLGSETVKYTIVGFNQEEKYSYSYPEPTMTIMSSVLSTNKQMFTTDIVSGTELKYTGSEVYKYLRDTIMPLLPTELQSGLKYSKKEFISTNSTTNSSGLKLWAPSYAECNYSGSLKYSYFTAKSKVIGRKADNTASEYWTRGYGASGWYYVDTTGSLKTTKTTTTEMGVRFCFGI